MADGGAGRGALRGGDPAGPVRARRWCSGLAPSGHGVPRRVRHHQGAAVPEGGARPCCPGCVMSARGRTRQRRGGALPWSATAPRDRALCDPCLRMARGARRRARRRHRDNGHQPGRVLRAARCGDGATVRLLRRLGRSVGLSRDLAASVRGHRQGGESLAVRAVATPVLGARGRGPRRGHAGAGRLSAGRRGSADAVPVPPDARRGRRANSDAGRTGMLRRGRVGRQDTACVHPRRAASTTVRSTT